MAELLRARQARRLVPGPSQGAGDEETVGAGRHRDHPADLAGLRADPDGELRTMARGLPVTRPRG